MADEKNFARTWADAEKILRDEGMVTLFTGGGLTWNRQVTERLSKKVGQPVILIGPYEEQPGYFQFSVNLKSNKAAKLLLAKDDIR